MTQRHIPQHIGIIMDGNNRWAKLRGKENLRVTLQVLIRFVV